MSKPNQVKPTSRRLSMDSDFSLDNLKGRKSKNYWSKVSFTTLTRSLKTSKTHVWPTATADASCISGKSTAEYEKEIREAKLNADILVACLSDLRHLYDQTVEENHIQKDTTQQAMVSLITM